MEMKPIKKIYRIPEPVPAPEFRPPLRLPEPVKEPVTVRVR